MSLAEQIYRVLLWFYPKEHRQAYAESMLLHVRDMSHAAQQMGRWHTTRLCLRLLKDGIVNAVLEHREVIMMTDHRINPSPWLSVSLASFPGLLLGLGQWLETPFIPMLSILGYMYLGILLLALPLLWYRKRQFPEWALLPAGVLLWLLTYLIGTTIAEQINALGFFGSYWMNFAGITVLSAVLATVVFAIVLRDHRAPRTFWLVLGIIVLGNLVLAALFSLSRGGVGQFIPGMIQYFTTSGVGPLDGLMIVAIGLLAARGHGSLAMLVVIGGYYYICADNDYLFGYPFLEWVWLPAYFAAMKMLYLVILPIGLLRARTHLSRALTVFIPLVAFHIIRLTVPSMVIQQKIELRPGSIILSINVVLNFVLAWVLYRSFDVELAEPQSKVSVEAIPLPG